jgi:hypothetical protein
LYSSEVLEDLCDLWGEEKEMAEMLMRILLRRVLLPWLASCPMIVLPAPAYLFLWRARHVLYKLTSWRVTLRLSLKCESMLTLVSRR